jgi:hypothetical protein
MPNSSITISLYCPICKADIFFAITADYFAKDKEKEILFTYKHGRPVHNAIIKLDKNLNVIDAEFKTLTRRGRPTKAALEVYLNNLKPNDSNEVNQAITKLLTDMPAVYDPGLDNSEERFQFYGFEVAEKSASVISGTDDASLLKSVSEILASGIAKVQNITHEGTNTSCEVLQIYKNPKIQDTGKVLYIFLKSFLHKLYSQKFQKSYLIKSDWDYEHNKGKFQIICQWSDWAEKLRKKMSAKKSTTTK